MKQLRNVARGIFMMQQISAVLLALMVCGTLGFGYKQRTNSIVPNKLKSNNKHWFENVKSLSQRDTLLKTVLSTVLASSISMGWIVPNAAAGEFKVFNEVWSLVNDNFFDETYNKNDWAKIKEEYTARLEDGANENALTKKMISLLGDKYTRLLDKKGYEALWKYDAIGVGLLFQSEPDKDLFVSSPPIAGSSAALAGIQKGDLILAINGISTSGVSAVQVLDMMSNDKQETVTIDFSSPNGKGERRSVVLKRATEVAPNPVTYSAENVGGKKVGYIKLADFSAEAVPGVRNALVALNAQDVDEVVLDLRGNLGGGFQFALNIGGMFMDNKLMATAVGKAGESTPFRTSFQEGVLFSKPLVLLTDGLSASSSEVLAGGLHDNCRASLAGSKTFGKGKIQAVFGLADGEGMTMTVAQYLTPRGTVIQSRGIEPDIPFATVDPYVNVLTGGVLSKVDLKALDFDTADRVVEMCKAVENTVAEASSSGLKSSAPDNDKI